VYAFLLLNPYNHLPTQTIIYLLYQFSVVSQKKFTLCTSMKYSHHFCCLDLQVTKVFTLHSLETKKSGWAAWMLHTQTLQSNIYARILWEKALQVYMTHNEKVHTKWKPMRYYYMLVSHLIYARIWWDKELQVYMIHNEKVYTKWKPMKYYYMLVRSVTRLGHSTSSRSKNWMPNLWPKLIL